MDSPCFIERRRDLQGYSYELHLKFHRGLAISAKLASFMGGDIRLESRPGAGSTFYFTAQFGISTMDASADPAASGSTLPSIDQIAIVQ